MLFLQAATMCRCHHCRKCFYRHRSTPTRLCMRYRIGDRWDERAMYTPLCSACLSAITTLTDIAVSLDFAGIFLTWGTVVFGNARLVMSHWGRFLSFFHMLTYDKGYRLNKQPFCTSLVDCLIWATKLLCCFSALCEVFGVVCKVTSIICLCLELLKFSSRDGYEKAKEMFSSDSHQTIFLRKPKAKCMWILL